MFFFFQGVDDHRYLHVLTTTFPTRRSSDLRQGGTCVRCSKRTMAGPRSSPRHAAAITPKRYSTWRRRIWTAAGAGLPRFHQCMKRALFRPIRARKALRNTSLSMARISRKSVAEGQRVSVGVDLGGGGKLKTKTENKINN